MAVTVLETLSPDDLAAYREYAGMQEGIENCSDESALSPEKIRDLYVSYWQFVAEILERYGIDGEEAEEAKISVYTGNIYTGHED